MLLLLHTPCYYRYTLHAVPVAAVGEDVLHPGVCGALRAAAHGRVRHSAAAGRRPQGGRAEQAAVTRGQHHPPGVGTDSLSHVSRQHPSASTRANIFYTHTDQCIFRIYFLVLRNHFSPRWLTQLLHLYSLHSQIF